MPPCGNSNRRKQIPPSAITAPGGIIKSIVKHPIASIITIGATAGVAVGATAALTAAGVAAAGPIVGAALALVGIGFGIAAIVNGAKGAKDATSDAQAKYAWETMGTGTAIVGLSTAAAVKSAKGIIQEYKKIPESTAGHHLFCEMADYLPLYLNHRKGGILYEADN